MIERQRCNNEGCRKLHSILPDKLVPYKHYSSSLIAGILDGDIMPEDTMNEDYPCDETMRRWNLWFMVNSPRIEGYCQQAVGFLKDPGLAGAAVLAAIREACDRWLPAVLRMVYHSGGFLVSV